MEWGFIWLMVVLKIPIALLLWLVWWAIRQDPDDAGESQGGGDGGSKVRHPHDPLPRHPRHRGPHGSPAPASPPRTRTKITRARTREH